MNPKRSPQPPLIGLRLKLESYVLCQVIKKLVCFDMSSPRPKVLDDSYLFSNANIEQFKYIQIAYVVYYIIYIVFVVFNRLSILEF